MRWTRLGCRRIASRARGFPERTIVMSGLPSSRVRSRRMRTSSKTRSWVTAAVVLGERRHELALRRRDVAHAERVGRLAQELDRLRARRHVERRAIAALLELARGAPADVRLARAAL